MLIYGFSMPLLDELKAWLDKNISKVPKDSQTYKAIYYTLNQWDMLTGYCADGKLNISNALAENAPGPLRLAEKTGSSVIPRVVPKPAPLAIV